MQLGLFSISYAGFWGQATLDLPEFIRHAADLGFDTVMFAGKRPQLSPLDASDAKLNAIKEVLDNAGICCSVVAAYNDFGAVSGGEVPLIEMQIMYAEALCRIAGKLGAKVVRLFTAYEGVGAVTQAIWQQTVKAIREICDRASEHDVTIAIQNHHDLAVETTGVLELLGDVNRPNCKLAFDAWSPGLRGEDLFQAAKLAAPHVAITTNADYIRLPRFRYRPELINYEPSFPELVRAVPFGTGMIDYARFFDGLRAGGFDGIATYEMCSPIRGGGERENLDQYARTYLDWMKSHLQT
jgi:sugar phosphate isomerase/epimerase